MAATVELRTPEGPARIHVDGHGSCLLVLGHGAGGGPDACDLVAARDAGTAAGFRVVRVEQPWRLAGRRVAPRPAQLDRSWMDVLRQLPTVLSHDGPLVVGGRSSGARVACRTAGEMGAVAILALAFPLVPPRRGASRLPELLAPSVPRLVVQGSRDVFGIPAGTPGLEVVQIAGADHGFQVRRRDGRTGSEVLAELTQIVRSWLERVADLG